MRETTEAEFFTIERCAAHSSAPVTFGSRIGDGELESVARSCRNWLRRDHARRKARSLFNAKIAEANATVIGELACACVVGSCSGECVGFGRAAPAAKSDRAPGREAVAAGIVCRRPAAVRAVFAATRACVRSAATTEMASASATVARATAVLRDGRYSGQRENTQTRQCAKELHTRRGRRGHYTLGGPNQATMFKLGRRGESQTEARYHRQLWWSFARPAGTRVPLPGECFDASDLNVC
jgi:hypothetical protein